MSRSSSAKRSRDAFKKRARKGRAEAISRHFGQVQSSWKCFLDLVCVENVAPCSTIQRSATCGQVLPYFLSSTRARKHPNLSTIIKRSSKIHQKPIKIHQNRSKTGPERFPISPQSSCARFEMPPVLPPKGAQACTKTPRFLFSFQT